MKARGALIVLAIGAALAPIPSVLVERYYSGGLYPFIQRGLTSLSNRVPVAAFDVLLVGVLVWLAASFTADLAHRTRLRWPHVLRRLLLRIATGAALLYLLFLAAWGLNYRRVALSEKLQFDVSVVSAAAVRDLALRAVAEVNGLYDRAAAAAATGLVDPSLPQAFAHAQRDLALAGMAQPGIPKRSMLDWYFRATGVDGMTDPYLLETLVVSDLLPFERPFVVAHEWGHLAGFAGEGEANFVGWLICRRGSDAVRYSGWLFLYRALVGALGRDDRASVSARLGAGPRRDLEAIADRIRRNIRPKLSAAGWQMYDRYLKANRVEAGAASYADVVRLAVGVRFSPTGEPLRR